jgi:hypothetical protein
VQGASSGCFASHFAMADPVIRKFRFTGPGIDVTGPVQGNGGFVSSLAVLQKQQELAKYGFPLGIYEPFPGQVVVFPEFTAKDDGSPVYVELDSVSIELANPDPESMAEASLKRLAKLKSIF